MENLRVSGGVKDDYNPNQYVEINMANQSDDDGESEADFYQPVGLSPNKGSTRNEKGSFAGQ